MVDALANKNEFLEQKKKHNTKTKKEFKADIWNWSRGRFNNNATAQQLLTTTTLHICIYIRNNNNQMVAAQKKNMEKNISTFAYIYFCFSSLFIRFNI